MRHGVPWIYGAAVGSYGIAMPVLPDDSAKPILEAIDGASRTLRVKMFVFSDPGLLKAVIAAKRRGVKVRVMLNPARRSGEHDNDATRAALERVEIDVKDANPAFEVYLNASATSWWVGMIRLADRHQPPRLSPAFAGSAWISF